MGKAITQSARTKAAGSAKIKGIMSGYQDPYSGVFGEPGAWDWSLFAWAGFAGFIALVMLIIFIGFDNGGFLHGLERRLGIRNMERPGDEELQY